MPSLLFHDISCIAITLVVTMIHPVRRRRMILQLVMIPVNVTVKISTITGVNRQFILGTVQESNLKH